MEKGPVTGAPASLLMATVEALSVDGDGGVVG